MIIPPDRAISRSNNRYSIAFGYHTFFSPTLTMNLIAGYEYWNQQSTGQSPDFQPTTLGLPSYLDQNTPEFPVFNIGSQSQLGTNNYNGTIPPLTSAAADFMKNVWQAHAFVRIHVCEYGVELHRIPRHHP